jgi:hypothetical protein
MSTVPEIAVINPTPLPEDELTTNPFLPIAQDKTSTDMVNPLEVLVVTMSKSD